MQNKHLHEIEVKANNRLVRKTFESLESVFTTYIERHLPVNYNEFYIVADHDIEESIYIGNPYSNIVRKFLKGKRWIASMYSNAYYLLHSDHINKIIETWNDKYPEVNLTFETINLKKRKFLLWGNTDFTVKMWKISWK